GPLAERLVWRSLAGGGGSLRGALLAGGVDRGAARGVSLLPSPLGRLSPNDGRNRSKSSAGSPVDSVRRGPSCMSTSSFGRTSRIGAEGVTTRIRLARIVGQND